MLARYDVRTPIWVYVTLAATFGLSGWIGWTWGYLGWWVWPLALAVPAIALFGARPYLVRKGAVELWPDRLEIPSWWGPPLVFPWATLRISQVRVVQDVRLFHLVPVGEVDRGVYLTFAAGPVSRRLSDRVFDQPAVVGSLLADLELARGGQAPRGPQGWDEVFAAAERAARATPKTEDRYLRAMEAAAPSDDD